MTRYFVLALIVSMALSSCFRKNDSEHVTSVDGQSKLITYVGRTDTVTHPRQIRQYAAGAYFTFAFDGTWCDVVIDDGNCENSGHCNYIEFVVDNNEPVRLRTEGGRNLVRIGSPLAPPCDTIMPLAKILPQLTDTLHTVLVCRDTETAMGYTALTRVRAANIRKWTPDTRLKIEFIGNSITCGGEAFTDSVPYGTGIWADRHMAYNAYGPRTARKLGAQWSLCSVSGIGLMRSCCDMNIIMPMVYDKVDLADNTVKYNFAFVPDIICICLGQNDGVQDMEIFCSEYRRFIANVRSHYANGNDIDIVLLTSPMADAPLQEFQRNALDKIVADLQAAGDEHISRYFFSKAWNNGGGGHPDYKQHDEIADELTAYLSTIIDM